MRFVGAAALCVLVGGSAVVIGARIGRTAAACDKPSRLRRIAATVVFALLASVLTTHAATPPVPMISGPITAPGAMFPSPALNLTPGAVQVEDFPYVTEEYFVTGMVNAAPYTTRIIVRRPRDAKAFSGTVVAEAMHGLGRSLIFEWSRVSILTRGHIFVEIVYSPAIVTLLKGFNAERYATQTIANGQANEIIAQIGRLIKSGSGPFAAYDVRRATLMGTSQSAGTVRSYLEAHPTLRMPDEGPIFDGFLLAGTLFNTPPPVVDVPMIHMPTQSEVTSYAQEGIKYRRPDSDEPGNRFRLYEVPAMPHNNARENPDFLNDPCALPVSSFPTGAFTSLALNHLVDWIASGKTPPHAPPIAVDQDSANDGSLLALDEYGNPRGGIRNVWVDVPIATYAALPKGKTPDKDRLCLRAVTEVRLPDATLRTLYGNSEQYASRVDRRLKELVAEGWFLQEYADLVREDAKKTKVP
jgi:hypothetical protein